MVDLPLLQIDILIRVLGMGLLHSLWQCAVVGALAWLALRTLRDAAPQARYIVACAALAACVLWPAAEVAEQLSTELSIAHGTQAAASPLQGIASMLAAYVRGDGSAATPLALQSAALEFALPWLVAAWAAGAGLMLLRLAGGLRWVHRLQRDARDCEDQTWQTRLDRLAQRFGLSGVRLVVSDDASGPLSTGILRPMVLVPASLFARMPVEMLEALLAHELAHIRRYDYLANLLQHAAEALLFHHPVVWWLSNRIRHEREQAADSLAVAVIGEPRRLALALFELDRFALEHTVSPALTLAQAAHGGHLMSRIQSLLRPERRITAGAVLFPIAGLTMACIACFAYAQSVQTRAAPAAAEVSVGRVAAAAMATPATAASAATTASTPEETYAFVNGDSDRLSMSGETDDIDDIRDARARLEGDFLWFRRNGDAYVLRDRATLERMRALWARNEGSQARMEALSAQMQAEAGKVEAIASRYEAIAPKTHETPRMREAIRELQALAEQQGALAQQQAALGATIVARVNDEKSVADNENSIDALGVRMEALGKQMETLENVIEAETEKVEASLAPLAAMEAEIEAATAPLEALGEKMEALGAEHEREMAKIDRQMRAEIDRAVAEGLATPAPRDR
jgi:beta-lactamase regulating signal transducer with metallopeptidase domain/chaperonin cofactor prefoldin